MWIAVSYPDRSGKRQTAQRFTPRDSVLIPPRASRGRDKKGCGRRGANKKGPADAGPLNATIELVVDLLRRLDAQRLADAVDLRALFGDIGGELGAVARDDVLSG